jgi:hypothetical protein
LKPCIVEWLWGNFSTSIVRKLPSWHRAWVRGGLRCHGLSQIRSTVSPGKVTMVTLMHGPDHARILASRGFWPKPGWGWAMGCACGANKVLHHIHGLEDPTRVLRELATGVTAGHQLAFGRFVCNSREFRSDPLPESGCHPIRNPGPASNAGSVLAKACSRPAAVTPVQGLK